MSPLMLFNIDQKLFYRRVKNPVLKSGALWKAMRGIPSPLPPRRIHPRHKWRGILRGSHKVNSIPYNGGHKARRLNTTVELRINENSQQFNELSLQQAAGYHVEKITLPATENNVTIKNASINDLNATAEVVCSSSPLVRARNIGTFAMGFIMAKNPINTVTAWRSMFSILYPIPSQLVGWCITACISGLAGL
jgi:hypothetical protein